MDFQFKKIDSSKGNIKKHLGLNLENVFIRNWKKY